MTYVATQSQVVAVVAAVVLAMIAYGFWFAFMLWKRRAAR